MPETTPLRADDPAVVGPYRLTGRLGMGGQGVVYLGTTAEGTTVAVKLLREELAADPRVRERFMKEIDAARRVDPFCIAQVLDASVVEGSRPYIVTEYIEGPSLQEAGPRQDRATLQRLAVATATALAAIHQAGIVHRDFKPSNVLLAPDGPRVIDFGIARASEAPSTLTSSIIGTPAYMAPEQFDGKYVGPAADVFAWGVVMVFAATGEPAFGADTLPAIMRRVLSTDPDLSALHEPLRSTVAACLAKEPGERPTMEAVLLRLLGSSSAPATGAPAFQAPARAPQMPVAAPPPVAATPQPPIPVVGPGSGKPHTPARQGPPRRRPALILGLGTAGTLLAAAVAVVLVWTQLAGEADSGDSNTGRTVGTSKGAPGQPGSLTSPGNPATGGSPSPGTASNKPGSGKSQPGNKPGSGNSQSPSPGASPDDGPGSKPGGGGGGDTKPNPPSGAKAYIASFTLDSEGKRGDCYYRYAQSYGRVAFIRSHLVIKTSASSAKVVFSFYDDSYALKPDPSSEVAQPSYSTSVSRSHSDPGVHKFRVVLRSPSRDEKTLTFKVCN
ncbi:protein kinase [Actinomadura sp. 6N118]|uniref:serine/threonine-protein kinase n=1 Tax=Actinomadura sp. 6N118 TaxID=3375151 RepID=UPI0037AD7F4F